MTEKHNHTQQNIKINKKLLLTLFLLLCLVSVFLTLMTVFGKSAEERLAAIQAARAIPDSENAAILYQRLFADYNESDIKPAFLTSAMEKATASKPWLSKDYPELAGWLEGKQNIIDDLLKLSKYEKCSFRIPDLSEMKTRDTLLFPGDSLDIDYLGIVKQWALLLARSANNDIAEGRLKDALEKSLCVIQMGNHFRDQPERTYFLVGISLQAIGSQRARYIIFNDDVSEAQLKKIETAFRKIPGSFEKQTEEIYEIERLWERMSSPNRSLRVRFIMWQFKMQMKKELKEIYLRFSTDYRANLVLIALKRYKNQTGQWPESLKEIKSLAPAKAFIDPATGKQLQYEKQGEDFSLAGESIKIWPR